MSGSDVLHDVRQTGVKSGVLGVLEEAIQGLDRIDATNADGSESRLLFGVKESLKGLRLTVDAT